ncbi:uncharacterized protein LOC105430713 [Pogonomyrmex barbatus]|uniref:Uncharacterized protein LOC105430713 n=1 Tax=Pogonomyrmex barbatus TaxID=144034 RepID=A0A6I9WM19_9HYME|nr:uncharacterized protein LOC105430713 [Pogonomyrmex barbatus]
MGSVSLDPRSMENDQERILLDRSSSTARPSKQNPDQSTSISRCQSEFWSSLQQATSNNSTRDGNELAKEESSEHLETLKFAFQSKKVKARGGRKANASKRRVTFADH